MGIQLVPQQSSFHGRYLKKTLKFYGPFLWMEFNCLKARATSRRQFTFTTKFPEIPGTHFTDLGRMDGGGIHFLVLKIEGIETDVYHKPTHIGQYFDFTSQTPWNLKTPWVKVIVNRAKKICCTPQNFNRQLREIKKFMAWNNYRSQSFP